MIEFSYPAGSLTHGAGSGPRPTRATSGSSGVMPSPPSERSRCPSSHLFMFNACIARCSYPRVICRPGPC
jgi:hypothetical protein